MAVSTTAFVAVQNNRTRGPGPSLIPKFYYFGFATVTGDLSGGAANLFFGFPNLAEELFVTLDHWGSHTLSAAAGATRLSVYDGAAFDIYAGSGDIIVLDRAELAAGINEYGAGSFRPVYLGKLRGAPTQALNVGLGANSNGIAGYGWITGRLFDVEPFGV